MKILREYHLPQRDALTVTLYEEGLIEIKQASPIGSETSLPIQLDSHDLGDLMDMLDSAKLAWGMHPVTTSLHGVKAPTKKKGPHSVG